MRLSSSMALWYIEALAHFCNCFRHQFVNSPEAPKALAEQAKR